MRISNVGLMVKDLEGARKFFEDYFGATVHAEYSEDNSRAEIRLEFAGPNVNPLDCCDEISRQLIDVATEHYEQNVVNDLTVIHFHVK